jgi:acetyl esterase/lipase
MTCLPSPACNTYSVPFRPRFTIVSHYDPPVFKNQIARLYFIAALLVAVLTSVVAHAAEPKVVELWQPSAPGALGSEDQDRPTLTVYASEASPAQRSAIVVCPGGGYRGLAMEHEGRDIARWLNSLGVTACVLKYRLGPRYRHPAPLQDVQRALRTVRASASAWKMDPAKIGILGFSAGGHLASTAATHFDAGHADASDAVDRQSCRPDFAILVYPVISLATEHAHAGSRENLLGPHPDPAVVEDLSNERRVTGQTPPCFLIHTNEDQPVPAENSVLFYLALRKAGVPAELHVFERGRHGLGLGGDDPAFSSWPKLAAIWLAKHGYLEKP